MLHKNDQYPYKYEVRANFKEIRFESLSKRENPNCLMPFDIFLVTITITFENKWGNDKNYDTDNIIST